MASPAGWGSNPQMRNMKMDVRKAMKVLYLRAKGPAGKIKMDVFHYRSQAEKMWHESAARMHKGIQECRIAEGDYQILQAYEALCNAWCQECGCVATKPHTH